MSYSHTQEVPTSVCLGVGALVLAATILVPLRLGKVLLAGTLAGAGYTFRSLKVNVDQFAIEIIFGGWYKARHIFIRDVLDCWTIRMNPVNGWGIHYTAEGWLYNVYGLNAVAVKLRDDSTVFIGTDEPSELVYAIRQQLNSFSFTE